MNNNLEKVRKSNVKGVVVRKKCKARSNQVTMSKRALRQRDKKNKVTGFLAGAFFVVLFGGIIATYNSTEMKQYRAYCTKAVELGQIPYDHDTWKFKVDNGDIKLVEALATK